MDASALFQALMAEAGGLAGVEAVHEVVETAAWVVAVDAETLIAVETDDARSRLTLSAEVGEVDDETPPERLRAMLAYGAAWRETGGMRLVLADDGSVELVVDLPAEGLDAAALADALVNFAGSANAWAASTDPGDAPDAPDADPSQTSFSPMRV